MNKIAGKFSLWGCCHNVSLIGVILCFVILVLTGFGPVFSGNHMSGYALMIHAVCSPVFVLCVTVLILSQSQRHAFLANEWKGRRCLRLTVKACYWLLLLLMLPLTLSIVLSMFPWVNTHGLEALFQLHWYSALVFSVTVGLYIATYVLGGKDKSST